VPFGMGATCSQRCIILGGSKLLQNKSTAHATLPKTQDWCFYYSTDVMMDRFVDDTMCLTLLTAQKSLSQIESLLLACTFAKCLWCFVTFLLHNLITRLSNLLLTLPLPFPLLSSFASFHTSMLPCHSPFYSPCPCSPVVKPLRRHVQ